VSGAIHPAISVNTLCLPVAGLPVLADQVAALGVSGISPTLEQVTACGPAIAAQILHGAGLVVATLTHRAFAFSEPTEIEAARDRMLRTIEIAHAITARSITFTTGGRGNLNWPEAADRFVAAIAPCAETAKAAGVKLSLEPTSHLYADASIAHRLTDAMTLVRRAGIHLGIDLFACWFDSDIETAIADGAGQAALVQVSDYTAGDRALPCRSVPGDGIIPLERLIPLIHATGFNGHYDIEIFGPRVSAEGELAALARAVMQLNALISEPSRDLAS